MKLEMPVLENLADMCKRSGTETFFTVQFPDGTSKTVDVNMAWDEILRSFRALEHFLDEPYRRAPQPGAVDYRNNPTGQKGIGEP